MYRYTVLENTQITPSTQLLTLQRAEHESPFAFQPGQYAAISFRRYGRWSAARCFSIATPPTDQSTLQFGMRIGGKFTHAIGKLQPGDDIDILGPYGGFVFDAARDKQVLFLAGGIGITPFMSMLRYAARLNLDNQITLLYGLRNQDDIAFRDELLAIAKKHDNIKIIFVVGDGPTDNLPPNQVATGFITNELIAAHCQNDYANTKFFICGPPVFMRAQVATLTKNNVPKKHIITEAFSQGSHRQTGILRSWPVNAYALGALGLILGGIAVTVNDLLHALPLHTSTKPTVNAPFLITNARQQTLNDIVNGIPTSPNAIIEPTKNPTPNTSSSTPTTTTQTIQSSPMPTYTAPKTTVSAPPP